MPRKSEIGATRNSAVYPIRLPGDLKEAWAAYCAKKGKSQQSVIRALMRYVMQDEMPPEVRNWVARQLHGEHDSGSKTRMEVRFTPSEHQTVAARAQTEGCSSQQWVINCVRASLTHEPQFTLETAKALWESSYQLRAIGRNLNQIAKHLNTEGHLDITTETITQLQQEIDMHTKKVSKLLNASLTRWIITTQN